MNDQPKSAKDVGVLFDVDGTLVDSTYFHTMAWWQAFRQQGLDVPMASIHRHIGMGGDKLLERLLPADSDRDIRATVERAHGSIFSTFWPAIRPFESARTLLQGCVESGLAVALASSANERDLQVLRGILDAEPWIDCATSSADAAESKPSPDILLAALEKLHLKAADVVFVGDSVWDVKAAARLGIETIGLTCGGISAAELFEAGAVEVYSGPRALLHRLDASSIGKLARRIDGAESRGTAPGAPTDNTSG
ncbi:MULTISPECIES: HAD family hydrolase [unclassified Arthrobacter]|jgi:phosphoglycolate phosphatase-like HAD superfamily hydrolase|uniref:HAD family hydrolase n=1 Tax=unclassified Arthrobacter TaxID=235627 RepID=UPI0022279FCF|nr:MULTISPECIES: HAD family hydrolase [unclassified Arthrobacter]UYY82750.1 HAD family hydrolase [Arthrobacter sp. YA7-1]